MTKHAVEGLTKAMAVELAPENIRVNSIAPTFLETPMTAPFFRDTNFRNWVLQRIPHSVSADCARLARSNIQGLGICTG
jgi:NAD(P)-dependent dehydrogenase (short-subunit alcohol dehydrogenase family)